MIIDVSFLYEASVLAPRKRNPNDVTYLAVHSVEVPDIDGSLAPVAMRWKLSRWDDMAPGEVLELRWHDDKLWRPLYEVTGNPRRDDAEYSVAKRDAAWLVGCAAKDHENSWSDTPGPFPTGRKPHGQGTPVPIDQDPNVHKVLSTRREARMAEISQAAARLLLVDGVPHVTCPEPVYVLKHYDRGSASLAPAMGGDPEDKNGPDRVFRADEYEYAMSSRHLDATPSESRIEVLLPEAVRFDGPARDVIRQAQGLRDWMKARISDRDVGFFSVYADLRDGLMREEGRHRLAPDLDPCARGVVEVARDALDALAMGDGVDDFWGQRVEAALARVDALSMGAEPAPGPGGP